MLLFAVAVMQRFIPPIFLALLALGQAAASPSLVITNLPAYGTTSNLAGLVSGVTFASYRVAAFIFVPGYGWVTKPTCGQPLTTIQPDGSWNADITTGGGDPNATRIAAFLVPSSFTQACVLGTSTLSTNLYSSAIASAVVTRPSPGVRFLNFSGYDWWVKTSAGLVGPGPNYFSDSTNNVWLDALGQLHLRITNRSNQWQCAELVSARTFGYGSYRFELASRVDNLNPNAILGLFTWSDDPAYTYREIDVECSRWGNAGDSNNSQFVVQPYIPPGHLARYPVPANQTNSTQLFVWQTNQVSFQSQRGFFTNNPAPGNLVTNWTYTLDIPRTGDENVRLNLWLMSGLAPTDNQEVEVIIHNFRFVPLGAARSASLDRIRFLGAGQFKFTLNGDPDWQYEVQASSNLLNWQGLTILQPTAYSIDFQTNLPVGAPKLFYRARTLP